MPVPRPKLRGTSGSPPRSAQNLRNRTHAIEVAKSWGPLHRESRRKFVPSQSRRTHITHQDSHGRPGPRNKMRPASPQTPIPAPGAAGSLLASAARPRTPDSQEVAPGCDWNLDSKLQRGPIAGSCAKLHPRRPRSLTCSPVRLLDSLARRVPPCHRPPPSSKLTGRTRSPDVGQGFVTPDIAGATAFCQSMKRPTPT